MDHSHDESTPEQAVQFHDHVVSSLKNDPRWCDYVMLAEKILQERGITQGVEF